MNVDMNELQRLAGMVPVDDNLQGYRMAANRLGIQEDVASGMAGWLKGISKGIQTWKAKLSKDAAGSGAAKALGELESAVAKALQSLSESQQVGEALAREAAKRAPAKAPVAPTTEHGKRVAAVNAAQRAQREQAERDDVPTEIPEDRHHDHMNWAQALLGDSSTPAPQVSEGLDPKARKKLVMGIYKRFKGQGDSSIKGGKHVVMLAVDGYKTVVLEDLSDDELQGLYTKYGVEEWLKKFG